MSSDEKDAQRYRWLRDNCTESLGWTVECGPAVLLNFYRETTHDRREITLDEAIDNSMKEKA